MSRKIGGTILNAAYIYTDGGRLEKEQYTNGSTQNYRYDELGRLYDQITKNAANSVIIDKWYEYGLNIDADTTTPIVCYEEINLHDSYYQYSYDYDANGNITDVTLNGDPNYSYSYDAFNQLTRAEVNGVLYTYEYDEGGNILYKWNDYDEEYIELSYADDNWKDLLTHYNLEELYYDEIGNPLQYRDGMTFTWQGRRLATASANGKSLSFKYNADGIRTQKTVNGTTTYFTLDGSKIISQKKGNQEIFFEYDAQGNVATMIYNGQTYYYVRNLTGEIIGLTDSSGNMIVEYLYDPWGKLLDYSNTGNFDLANLNPFKYKDYYYDSELGFYYLNSRYYDPVTSRFINASETIPGIGVGILDYNLFAYCNNNPIVASEVPAASITHTSSLNNVAINYVNVEPIEVMDTAIYYNVPLYDQDDYNLCWAFCQIMVEDYRANRITSNENATSRAISLSISIHGPDKEKWNAGEWPTNICFDVRGEPIFASEINSITDLYESSCNNGPMYGYYWNGNIKSPAHLVVITGVNLSKGIIYTNNPWYFAGGQSYSEFMAGVAWHHYVDNMPFWGYLHIN